LPEPGVLAMVRYAQTNSVLMDNMTLQGALRILSLPARDATFTTYPRTDDELHSLKWDYDLNDGFRVATDLACLGQLVQCLILHDKIFVDGSGTSTWADQRIMLSGDPGTKRPTDDYILPLRPSSSEARTAFEKALSNVNSWSDSTEFADYLGLLATCRIEAAVFEISNGYFQTGFSDPVLFAGEQRHSRINMRISDGSDGSQLLPLFLDEMPYRLLDDVLASLFDKRSKAFRRNAGERRRRVARGRHPWAKAGLGPGDVDEKLRAYESLIRHAVATCYYGELSNRAGIPYLPHPLRSRIAEFEAATHRGGARSLAAEITKALELARAERSHLANIRLGSHAVQVHLPMFLSRAIKDAGRPEDILDAAVEIRQSNEGRRFREWMHELQDGLLRGNPSLAQIEGKLDRVERDLRKWAGKSPRTEGDEIGIELNFGLVTLTKNSAIPFFGRSFRTRRHLKIFHSTARLYDEVLRLEPHIKRVFGEAVATSYEDFQDLLAHLEATAAAPLEHRGRLLRRERPGRPSPTA
jgi:hypothetical protein